MKNILLIFGLLGALGASGQGTIYINSFTFGAAPAAGLLLDNYPAQAAYSLRKLRTSYAGNCLVVRKTSTGDTLAIGWDGNYVDTAAIVTFCTGTNCTVRRWYDQSGNGRDVVQATSTAQPTIFSAGAILTQGTKKAIKGDGGDFLVATFTRNQPHSAMYVGTITTGRFGMDATTGVNDASVFNNTGQTRLGGRTGGTFSGYNINVNPVNYVLISSLWNGASSQGRVNTTSGSGTVGTNGAGGVTIFAEQNNSAGLGNTGFTQEVIIWTSNNTSDWSNIQADINSFYTIY
jgi:hypothetical protein